MEAELLNIEQALENHRADVRLLARCWRLLRRLDLSDLDRAAFRDLYPRLLSFVEDTYGRVLEIWLGRTTEQLVLLTQPKDDKSSKDDKPSPLSVHAVIDAAAPASTLSLYIELLGIVTRARQELPRETADVASRMGFELLIAMLRSIDEPPTEMPEGTVPEPIYAEVTRLREYVEQASRRDSSIRFALALGIAVLVVGAGLGAAIAAGLAVTRQPFVACVASGIVGSVVSAMSRSLRWDSGAPAAATRIGVASLALVRLAAGGLAAFAGYVLISGGVLGVRPIVDNEVAFYAAFGFLLGFTERLVGDGQAVANSSRQGKGLEGVGESAASHWLASLPSTVQSSVRTAMKGPELVAWKGFVRVTITEPGPTGRQIPSDVEGIPFLIPGRTYEVSVTFTALPSGDTTERAIEIKDGRTAPETPFTVAIDSDDLEVDTAKRQVRVRPGGEARVKLPLQAPHRTGRFKLWVHVLQYGSTIQLCPLTFLISDDTPQ